MVPINETLCEQPPTLYEPHLNSAAMQLGPTVLSIGPVQFAPQLSEHLNKNVVKCIILGAIAIYAIVAVLG